MPKNAFVAYNGIYALCSSAKCILTKKGLLCYCDVNKGLGVGINNGQSFTPYKKNSKMYLYSLYSAINGKMLSKQTCQGGTWGDCLNKTCFIDPRNPKKAFCLCPPLQSSPWITFQHKKNTGPCPCNNLSGAINNVYTKINKFYKATLMKQRFALRFTNRL
jgi:hypothetical protein